MWRKNKEKEKSKHNNNAEANVASAKTKKSVRKQKRHKRVRMFFFVLICFVLVVLIASLIGGYFLPGSKLVNAPWKIAQKIITPIQEAFSNGSGWFFDQIDRLKLRSTIEKEYEELYDKYDELLSEVMMVEQLKAQLSAYEELETEMQTHSQYASVAARVIATDSTNYFSTLTINVGSNQGIKDYMAVVKSGGLVGYTYDVTETTSKVQTIIGSDTSIAAMLQSTHYQGTVKGTMGINGEPMCRMYYLNESHLPRQGDIVVTSGVGLEFPKGIPIGTVKESTRGMESGKSFVVVEPIVDFERVEYVIVYCYTPSYAEQAENRDGGSQNAFIELTTARPVPTFAINGSGGFNVTAEPENATPAPMGDGTDNLQTQTPQDPNDTPAPDGAPTMTPPPNISYDDIPGTPTPVPTPTPTPTPVPTPTYSLDDLTVEED